MTNQPKHPTNSVREDGRQILQDHIYFLADKYGVSKNTIITIMSIAGPNDALIEKILRDNRFVR